MLSRMTGVFRNECNSTLPTLLVGVLQIYTGKLNKDSEGFRDGGEADPQKLLNLTPTCQKRLINKGSTLLGFLPVSKGDGDYNTPAAPLDQFPAVPDEIMQGNASPDQIPFLEYLTSTTVAEERG